MEERLANHAAHIEATFSSHTKDEMERYQEIIDKIDKVSREAAARHSTLLSAFENFNEAFPVNDKGKPDFHGHAQAHKSWIEQSKEAKDLHGYVKKVVLASAATALVSWVTFLIWNGVLHGPVK